MRFMRFIKSQKKNKKLKIKNKIKKERIEK